LFLGTAPQTACPEGLRIIMKNINPITRREAIEACVKSYIKNNPVEYQEFSAQVIQKRRELGDNEFGIATDDLEAWKKGTNLSPMRQMLAMPEKLYTAIETILRGHDNQDPFPEDDTEERWFIKQYPEFYVPEKY
jgi:hypothetical protein